MTDADVEEIVGLTIPADPHRVAVVRRAVSAFLRSVGAEEDFVTDINTAVSEACENAILHGYPNGSRGPIDVRVFFTEPIVRISVRDEGTGMQPRLDEGPDDAPRLRLGLPLMTALSHELQVRCRPSQGTEVVMSFDLGGNPTGERVGPDGVETVRRTELRVANHPGGLGVLRPALLMIAAQVGMTVDRIEDLKLLTDLIGTAASKHDAETLTCRIETPGDSSLRILLGPFEPGAGAAFLASMALPMPGGGVERLVDEITVEAESDGELIALEVARGTA